MIGIYCFTNLINNKKYIGQSIVLEQRYKQHIRNINNEKIWTSVTKNEYPIRDSKKCRAKGSRVNIAIFNEQEVMEIRKRYANETIPQIYEDYRNICSQRAIQKICYGHTFSFLPYYVKRSKKWILNGTCIDYLPEGE